VALGEFPYYRADPARWADLLRALRELGIDVVTASVPWRLHEVGDGRSLVSYDFDGRFCPHANLIGFLQLAKDIGIFVMLRTGPYIFAEVRLGGLPDRVVPGACVRALDAGGDEHRIEGRSLPSAYDPDFRRIAAGWLSALRVQALSAMTYPAGPVIAVQLGNEGIFEGVDGSDYSAAAVAHFTTWAGMFAASSEPARVRADSVLRSAELRERWNRWAGPGLADLLGEFRAALGDVVPSVASLPLPQLASREGHAAAWMCRVPESVPSGVLRGYTSWAGNAWDSDSAFLALWFGVRALRADSVEENWGFTWTDTSYAQSIVPVYNALLGMAFGSTTISVYTACTTRTWPGLIAPCEEGPREAGIDAPYTPPYCPGAPLDESGSFHPNASGLRLLTTFLRWHGLALRRGSCSPSAWLVADPVTLSAPAHGAGADPTPVETAISACGELLLTGACEPDVALLADIQSGCGPWIVVGGGGMSRSVQQALAARVQAGDLCAVIGELPVYDERWLPCTDLAEAVAAFPGRTAVLPVTGARPPLDAADWGDFGPMLSWSLSASRDANGHRPRPVLALRRSDTATSSDVLFCFSRSQHEQIYQTHLGGAVTVRLCPRGAAVLLFRDSVLTGFLVKAVNEITGTSVTVEVSAGDDRVLVDLAADAVGRRTPVGWEIALFRPLGRVRADQ
jgi:beta-galactosidase